MFIYYKVSCSGGYSLPKNLNFVTKVTVLQDTKSTNHFRDVSKEKGRGSRDDRKKRVWTCDTGLWGQFPSEHSSCDQTQGRVLGTIRLVSQGACDHGGLVLKVQPGALPPPGPLTPAPARYSWFPSRMVNSPHYQGSNFIF